MLDSIVVSEDVRKEWTFPPFWAVRPTRGNTLGRNFLGPYKDDVRRMVERGCLDKGKKMSSAQIKEQLKAIYRSRYDIPSMHHIASYVTVCLKAIREAEVRERGAGRNPQLLHDGPDTPCRPGTPNVWRALYGGLHE